MSAGFEEAEWPTPWLLVIGRRDSRRLRPDSRRKRHGVGRSPTLGGTSKLSTEKCLGSS